MKIVGLQKLTLLDYPGQLAATIFFGGCDFRCPYCHNQSLWRAEEGIDEEVVLAFLRSRVGKLAAVCLSGGEALLSLDVNFVRTIKELGYLVKIDTNGTSPKRLQELIDLQLVDYIAMDIKAGKNNYPLATGGKGQLAQVIDSINIIRKSNIAHHFRLTVVAGITTFSDIEEIAEFLEGEDLFVLQPYVRQPDLPPSFQAPSIEVLQQYQQVLSKTIKKVVITGLSNGGL